MEIPDYVLSSFPPARRWHTVKLKVGEPLFGWVAGRGIPARVHQIANASRPCVAWLTSEGEFCPYCESKDLQDKVYLPFYLEPTWERKVVHVSKTAWEHVQRFDFLTRFSAEKNSVEGQPNIFKRVRRSEGDPVLPHGLREDGPQCIKEYLNYLWGLTARSAWKPKGKKKSGAKPAADPASATRPPTAEEQQTIKEKLDRYRFHIGLGGEQPPEKPAA